MTRKSFARAFGVFALQLAAVACEFRMSHVTLEDTRVHEEASSLVRGEPGVGGTEAFLDFTVSSDQDLLEFSTRWLLQTRCTLKARNTGIEFETPVWGPFHNGHDVSRPRRLPPDFKMTRRADGRFEYHLYAFPKLMASEFRDHEFVPKPLAAIEFEQIECYLIGVQKAPVIFPRSNEWILRSTDLAKVLPRETP